MALVQIALTVLSRQASKLLNTAFGWATTLLFGKVSADRQIYLSVISMASVIWLVVVAGIAFPRFATFLLSFASVPSWIHPAWIRLGMLVGALVIPLVVGVLSLKVTPTRPDGEKASVVSTVLRGYPSTVGIALTLVLLTVFAPVLQIRQLLRRWSSAHVPVIVEQSEYMAVVGEIESAIDSEGFSSTRRPASWMVRMPTKLIVFLASGTVNNLIADRLTLLVGEQFEILLHPADLVISAREDVVDRLRAVIAERMMFADANLTWTKEANEVEDRLIALWKEMGTESEEFLTQIAPLHLDAIARKIRPMKLSYEEWEILSRLILGIDRALLAVAAEAVHAPDQLFEGATQLGSLRLAMHEGDASKVA